LGIPQMALEQMYNISKRNPRIIEAKVYILRIPISMKRIAWRIMKASQKELLPIC